jgi:hypothetical protein
MMCEAETGFPSISLAVAGSRIKKKSPFEEALII